MEWMRKLTALLGMLCALAHAAEDTILIQIDPDGRYRVWHSRGESMLSEAEIMALETSAAPAGGPVVETAAGSARAYAAEESIRIEIPAAPRDKTLLVSRDPCGWASAWHSAGAFTLSDEELTELAMTALPTGGKNVPLGTRIAKSYTSKLGVVAVIWDPVPRRRTAERLQ